MPRRHTEPRNPPWESVFRQWHDGRESRNRDQVVDAADTALRRVRDLCAEDFSWFEHALMDAERRWFVAALFAQHSLPRRLFEPMLQAALRDCDATEVKYLVRPCAQTFGAARVNAWLEHARESRLGSADDIAKAAYWAVRAAAPRRG